MSIGDLNIPVLETQRLILRGHRLDDFEAMVEIWTDPVVQRHFHGANLNREEIWSKLVRQFGGWAAFGYGLFAVEEKATGSYVGMVGAFEGRRELSVPVSGMPEAGWTLATSVHGRGYATEATKSALAWMDQRFGLPMFCIVSTENLASIRVAEKCGFERWCETTYKDDPTLVFRRNPRA